MPHAEAQKGGVPTPKNTCTGHAAKGQGRGMKLDPHAHLSMVTSMSKAWPETAWTGVSTLGGSGICRACQASPMRSARTSGAGACRRPRVGAAPCH
jgi:hypothetical protein